LIFAHFFGVSGSVPNSSAEGSTPGRSQRILFSQGRGSVQAAFRRQRCWFDGWLPLVSRLGSHTAVLQPGVFWHRAQHAAAEGVVTSAPSPSP